jgi:hypothetical protein
VAVRVSRWVGPVAILLPVDRHSDVSCSKAMLMQGGNAKLPGLEETARLVGLADPLVDLLLLLRLAADVDVPTLKLLMEADLAARLDLIATTLRGPWLKVLVPAPLACQSFRRWSPGR